MVTPYIRQQLYTPIVRLRVTPDEPEAPPAAGAGQPPPAIVEQRPRASRRHTDSTVAKVRQLVEHTDLTYVRIAALTGVNSCSIRQWERDGGWRRPAYAPR